MNLMKKWMNTSILSYLFFFYIYITFKYIPSKKEIIYNSIDNNKQFMNLKIELTCAKSILRILVIKIKCAIKGKNKHHIKI